ncbi:hypothetical protein I4U23_000137 [Adineta vaga]|nr:hypothetical protein I4U23_000137 [Adineta vaga]
MGNCCCCHSPPHIVQIEKPLEHRPSTPIQHSNVKANASKRNDKRVPSERFNKRGFSENNLYPLIQGFEDEQLLSLEETLEEFIDEQPQLSDYIKEAKTHCNKSTEHGLTEDESAAIYIYSMRNDEQNGVYDLLEKAWESRERSVMKPWFKYLRLFQSALDKLPNVKGKIWQGILFNKNDQTILEDSLELYSCMSMCALTKEEVVNFFKEESKSKLILISFESIDGKDMSDYTKNSKEVIIWPGYKICKIQDSEIDNDGIVCFHLTKFKDKPEEREEYIRSKVPIDIQTIPIDLPTIISNENENHFVCPMKSCRNCCDRNHESNHCRGFSFIYHNCSHHCGPRSRCFFCKKHVTKLHQCNQCNWRLCDDCCFKLIKV